MSHLIESIVEDVTLSWFGELGYGVGLGPLMTPGEPAASLRCQAPMALP